MTTQRPMSVGANFKTSIQKLVENLAKKIPHYVRCIKPNGIKSPGRLDIELVQHQTRYLGLIENVRVRRAGFATRMEYARFLQRFKMLSKKTWPSWNSNLKEGSKAIIDDMGISEDVQWGHTKIFIRSAQSIFKLEQARTCAVDWIVVILQKRWRGVLARRLAKRIRAANKIINAYRHYKIRSYIVKFVANFSSLKSRSDYGKELSWPQYRVPKPCIGLEAELKRVFNRWRANKVLGIYPKAKWPEIRLKLVGTDILLQKGRSKFNIGRDWRGDYLCQASDNPTNSLAYVNARDKIRGDRKVLFSGFASKLNKKGKTEIRAIIITDLYIHELTQCKAFKKGSSPVLLEKINSITVSKGTDQIIILHFLESKSDLVFNFLTFGEDRIPELVAKLFLHCKDAFKKELTVDVVENDLNCKLRKKKCILRITNGVTYFSLQTGCDGFKPAVTFKLISKNLFSVEKFVEPPKKK